MPRPSRKHSKRSTNEADAAAQGDLEPTGDKAASDLGPANEDRAWDELDDADPEFGEQEIWEPAELEDDEETEPEPGDFWWPREPFDEL